jgi:hypothetical protein
MDFIDISTMDKADVLLKLFNGSKPLGLGFLQNHAAQMTKDEANKLLQGGTYFDYVRGRVMKVDLTGDTFNPTWYDRDNGEGAAALILSVEIPI